MEGFFLLPDEVISLKQIYEQGLRFTCTQCAHCCKDEPGYVFLSEEEISAIAAHLSLSRLAFLQHYCRRVQMADIYMISLLERRNNDCVFLTEAGCRIYQARPLQCRSYPFWDSIVSSREYWDQEARDCPGMNQGELHSKEEIERWLALRRAMKPKILYTDTYDE